MSLFPAYNEGEEGSSKYDARQDWLQNESYPDKFKATTSTAEVQNFWIDLKTTIYVVPS